MQQTTNVIDSVHDLENAGMNRPQAETLTKLVRDSIAEALESVVRNMATKTELADLKAHVDAQHKEIKTEVADLKAHVDAQHKEIKTEVADLRAHVDAQHKEIKTEVADLKAHVDTQHKEIKTEVADLRAHVDTQHKEIKARLNSLEAFNEARTEVLKGEIAKEVSKSVLFTAVAISLATIAVIATLRIMPAAG